MPLQGNDLHVTCQILPGGKFSDLLGGAMCLYGVLFITLSLNAVVSRLFKLSMTIVAFESIHSRCFALAASP